MVDHPPSPQIKERKKDSYILVIYVCLCVSLTGIFNGRFKTYPIWIMIDILFSGDIFTVLNKYDHD